MKIQTQVEISKNIVSPPGNLLEKGTHVERAEFVLHVHICAEMIAKIPKFTFC